MTKLSQATQARNQPVIIEAMAKMILVDFDTISDLAAREQAKQFLIEHLVKHPDTLVTVLNSRYQANADDTKAILSVWRFPFDGVAVNPLTLQTPGLVFKTMFAASMSDRAEHTAVLVIDIDEAARDMWQSAGVPFTLNPVPNTPVAPAITEEEPNGV